MEIWESTYEVIRAEVRKYGEDNVIKAGIETVGYPGTWATSYMETVKIRRFFRAKERI